MGKSPRQHLLFSKMMYKSMTLLVLVAACCVLAAEPQQQDQEGAEQYYHSIQGFYPSWYPAAALGVVRVYPYAYGHYNYYGAYPYGVIPGAQPALYGSLPQHVKVNAVETKQDAKNKITAGRSSAEIQQKQSAFFSKVVGKYCLDGQENFEQYLEAIGLNMDIRAVVMKQVPCVKLNYHGDEWSVKITGISKDYDYKFRFGVEMKRATFDGRQVTALYNLMEEGDTFKIVQKETWGNFLEAVIVYELDGDNWKAAFTLGDVKASRHFRRE